MKLSHLSIKTKLILTFLFVGATPLLISSLINYFENSNEYESLAQERAKRVAEMRAYDIASYFQGEKTGIVDLANNLMTIAAIEELSAAFEKNQNQSNLVPAYRQDLIKFYNEQFAAAYQEKTKQNISIENLASK